MPNGFEDQLKKWQAAAAAAWASITSTETKLKELGQPIPTWQKILSSIVKYAGYAPPNVPATFISTLITGKEPKLPFVTGRAEQLAATSQEYSTALSSYNQAIWFSLVYASSSEGLIQAGITSSEDFIRKHPPELGSSEEDIAAAKAYIDRMLLGEAPPGEPLTAAEEAARAFILAPAEARPKFEGIHTTTREEMVKWLERGITVPELPAELEEEELTAWLSEQGHTAEELAEAEAWAGSWASQIEEWEQGRAQIKRYQMGVETAQMPPRSFGEKLELAASQPALALVDALHPYWKYVEYPLAAGAVLGLGAPIRALAPGENAFADRLEACYKANKASGMSQWMSLSKAWEEVEANKWAKLGAEIVLDPINLLGFGISAPIAAATKTIPVIGRVTALAKAAEFGFIKAVDVPFIGIKRMVGAIPKSASQLASIAGQQNYRVIKSGVEKGSGKALTGASRITNEEFSQFVNDAMEYAIQNPDAVDYMAAVGRAYMERGSLTNADMLEWGTKLGSELAAGDVTPGMVGILEDIVDNTITRGSIGHQYQLEAAAQKICREVFNVGDSEANMVVAKNLIKGSFSKGITKGKAMADLPVGESLKAARANAEAMSRTASYQHRWAQAQRSGFWAAVWNDVEPIYRTIWANGIDKHLIMPFARAYLITGSYAPGNYAEEVFRTFFGKGGLFHSKNAGARFEAIATGLMYDEAITEAAWMSKYSYGEIAKVATRATPNRALGQGEMSQAALLGQLEQQTSKPALENILFFNWLPTKTRKLSEALYFPIRASQMGGGIQRPGYMRVRFLDELNKAAPEEVMAIANAVGKAPKLPGVPKKVAKAFQQQVNEAAVVGPNAVRNVMKEFTYRNIKMSEANEAVAKHLDLDAHTRDFIMSKAESGELWSDVSRFIKEAEVLELDNFISKPESQAMWLRDLVDEALVGAEKLETKEQLMGFAQIIRDVADVAPETVSDLFVASQEKISKIRSAVGRREAWAESFRHIQPYLDESEKQAQRLIDHIRKATPEGVITTDQWVQLEDNLTIYMQRIAAVNNVRRDTMAMAEEMIVEGVHPGTAEWYGRLKPTWDKWHELDAELFASKNEAAQVLQNMIDPRTIPTPEIDASIRGLTPADVGNLLYAPGDKLSYAVANVKAMMGKPYFVATVRSEANKMAARMGTTREALGFTDEAIAQVHDQLVHGLRSNPEFHNAVSKQYGELDNLAADLESIRINKSLDPAITTEFGKYANDVAGNLEGLDIYKTDVKGSADWWKSKQGAMDNAMKTYYRDFTDYHNLNIVDTAMRQIYPYWTYESVSEDSQILTREGWKYHNELVVGEEVLSLNPDTMVSGWVPLEHINVYDFDGEAYQMKDWEADFIFTKEHNWLVLNPIHRTGYFEDNIEFVKSEDLAKRHKIPRGVTYQTGSPSILSPHDAAVLGWLVTDGYKEKQQMIICQSKEPGKSDIKNLLALDGDVKYREYYGYYKYIVPKPCQQRIESVYGGLGDLIPVITHLSGEAANAMLYSMMMGDGDKTGHFHQKPGIVMEAFQILCAMAGEHANMSGVRIHSGFEIQCATVYKARHRHPVNIRTIQYTGKMWCPTTKYGTFLMRREGKVIWTGNSQRWFWLPRNFATHPGVMNAWGKYMDNTDFGYIHIPGTSLEINITRGTVYKGGLGSLVRRDYPEYYDRYFPELFETMDYGQRYGFFPNVFWSLLVTEFGGRQPQRGQILPALTRTPLDLYVAANPDSESARAIYETLFPDYFRDYLTICETSHRATDDQVNRGITGVSVWGKMQRHEELAPEEQVLWDGASGHISSIGPLMQHAGTLRLRHQDRIDAYILFGKYIEEMTGISPEMQDELRKHGQSVGDVVPNLSQLDMLQIEEAMEYKRWIAPRVTAPLRPSNEIEDNLILSEYWGMVKKNREASMGQIKSVEAQAFLGEGGWISREDYIDQVRGVMADNGRYIHTLHGDTLNKATGQWEPNPAAKTKFSMVPITLEQRRDYYAEWKINLSMNTFDEMLAEWFQLSPKEKIDPETGVAYTDWGTFFATQAAIEKLMPPELKNDWETYLRHSNTPGWILWRDAVQKHLVPYWNVADVVKKELFTTEEQRLIDEYYQLRKIDPIRAQEMRDITRADGTKLISQYSIAVTNARKRLRMAMPMVDAQLLYWGRTTTLLTPEAQLLFNQITEDNKATISSLA